MLIRAEASGATRDSSFGGSQHVTHMHVPDGWLLISLWRFTMSPHKCCGQKAFMRICQAQGGMQMLGSNGRRGGGCSGHCCACSQRGARATHAPHAAALVIQASLAPRKQEAGGRPVDRAQRLQHAAHGAAAATGAIAALLKAHRLAVLLLEQQQPAAAAERAVAAATPPAATHQAIRRSGARHCRRILRQLYPLPTTATVVARAPGKAATQTSPVAGRPSPGEKRLARRRRLEQAVLVVLRS